MESISKVLIVFFLLVLSPCIANGEKWDRDKSEWSPLMVAIYNDDVAKFTDLIDKKEGICFSTTGKNSHWILTPLDVAIRTGNIFATEKLLGTKQYGQLDEFLTTACTQESPEVVQLLISYGADPKLRFKDNFTLLMKVASSGKNEILDVLLQNGADDIVNERHGRWGATALMYAAKSKSLSKVSLLLNYNADINIIDGKGKRAIDFVDLRSKYNPSISEEEIQQIKNLLQ